LDEAAAAIRRVLALASELGADTSAIQVDLASDPVTASYQIAALAPVDPLDGLAMLSSAGPASRLRVCLELLDGVAEDLRRSCSTRRRRRSGGCWHWRANWGRTPRRSRWTSRPIP